MGLCGSSLTAEQKADIERSRAIERANNRDQKAESEIIKLLLLGAGESGKSTIFKQMKILHGVGFTDEEKETMKPVVFNNVNVMMKAVIENAKPQGCSIQNAELAQRFLAMSDEAEIDSSMGTMITTLWNDAGFQQTWEKRGNFQVQDSLSYYCKNMDRISAPGYLPDLQDILRTRVRTSGIVEEKYVIDGVNFSMYDVGGQRNERKKWIHCFDNVTAVIFVAAISEYDQVLYEDTTANRMDEAINLFEEICNSNWFRRTSMILFLNKTDLFEEKLFKIPLRVPGVRFDDFNGPYANDPGVDPESALDAGKAFMVELFTSKKADKDKEIYHHVTCATDTENVKVVFNACKDIILRDNLKGSGFME